MIGLILFLIGTISFLLKRLKNRPLGTRFLITANYLIALYLFSYYTSSLAEYSNIMLSFGINGIESNLLMDEITFRLFVLLYIIFSIIISGISISMAFNIKIARNLLIYSLPFFWFFNSIKISLTFYEKTTMIDFNHLAVLKLSIMFFGIISGLIMLLYNLRGMKRIFEYKNKNEVLLLFKSGSL